MIKERAKVMAVGIRGATVKLTFALTDTIKTETLVAVPREEAAKLLE